MKKLFLFIFTIFLNFNLYSKDFMMNCTSPDFKSTAFYKFKKTENSLFVRPMKKKWTNFCEKNIENEKNISCNFQGLNVLRNSIVEKDNNIYKLYLKFNFSNYTLEKTLHDENNEHKSKKLTKIAFKCRKIKI